SEIVRSRSDESGALRITVEAARAAVFARFPRNIFRRDGLVDVHSQPGILVRVAHRIPNLRQPRVQLLQLIAEVAAFANPKRDRQEIDMQVDAVANWRLFGWSMPRRLDPVVFAEHRDFARHVEAANRRDVTAEIVDQAIFHEWQPLEPMREGLTHR